MGTSSSLVVVTTGIVWNSSLLRERRINNIDEMTIIMVTVKAQSTSRVRDRVLKPSPPRSKDDELPLEGDCVEVSVEVVDIVQAKSHSITLNPAEHSNGLGGVFHTPYLSHSRGGPTLRQQGITSFNSLGACTPSNFYQWTTFQAQQEQFKSTQHLQIIQTRNFCSKKRLHQHQGEKKIR